MGAMISKLLPSRGGVDHGSEMCGCDLCQHAKIWISPTLLDEVLAIPPAPFTTSTVHAFQHGEVTISSPLLTLPVASITPLFSNTLHVHPKPSVKAPLRFLGLPPELRCMVYEELLVVGKVYFKGTDKEHANSVRYKDKAYFQKPFLMLLGVCKLIHQEAEPIYLSKNLFVLPLGWQSKEPFRSAFPCTGRGYNLKAPHLFSRHALIYLKNLSITIDMDENSDLKMNARSWKKRRIRDYFQDVPDSDRLAEIHEFLLTELEDGLDGDRGWNLVSTTLSHVASCTPHGDNYRGLDYVEFDYTNAYCPIGCCRPVWLFKHNWMDLAIPTTVCILGSDPGKEQENIVGSMKDDGLDLQLYNVEFKDAKELEDRWAKWKCERRQRYVPITWCDRD